MMNNYRFQDIKYLLIRKIWLTIFGMLKGNLVRVFYVKWSNNFGDLLTQIILQYYHLTPVFAYPKKAQAVVIGTILEIIDEDFSGYILGCGWTRDISSKFQNAKIKGVRGLLTKKSLHLDDNVTIGDPGLLISDILPYEKQNQYKLGIIPHESEIYDYRLEMLKTKMGDDVLIINPQRTKCNKVLKEIVSCSFIVSSSLHGLIVSDSYNIPNGRIKFNNIDDSNDYKFKDYYSSIGEELRTYTINGNESLDDLVSLCRIPPIDVIEEIKISLNKMFYDFSKEVRR